MSSSSFLHPSAAFRHCPRGGRGPSDAGAEPALAAVLREAGEETGAALAELRFLGRWPDVYELAFPTTRAAFLRYVGRSGQWRRP